MFRRWQIIYDTSTLALKTTFKESSIVWEHSKNVTEAYQQLENNTSERVEVNIDGMETDEEVIEAIKEAHGATELIDITNLTEEELEELLLDFLEEESTTETAKEAIDGSEINAFSDPTDNSKTSVDIFASPNVAVSTSTSTIVNDYIYVRNRIISGSGEELTDLVVAEYNSSYVSASTEHPNIHAGFGDYAMGNHIYRLSGYKDNIHETDKRF